MPGTVKRPPARVFCIRFDIGRLDRHPVWCTATVSANLSAYFLTRGVKGGATNSSKAVDYLLVVSFEDYL